MDEKHMLIPYEAMLNDVDKRHYASIYKRLIAQGADQRSVNEFIHAIMEIVSQAVNDYDNKY